jgi:hypothetical protein
MNYSCVISKHGGDEDFYSPLNPNSPSNKSITTKWYGAITDQSIVPTDQSIVSTDQSIVPTDQSIVPTDVENIFTPENSQNQETNDSEKNKGKIY